MLQTQYPAWLIYFALGFGKNLSTLPQPMHLGFAELVAGLSDVVDTTHQCLKRAFEVSGEVYPVFAIDV